VSPGFDHHFFAPVGELTTNVIFREFQRVLSAVARIWFQFVETVIRNHIDEWLLIRE